MLFIYSAPWCIPLSGLLCLWVPTGIQTRSPLNKNSDYILFPCSTSFPVFQTFKIRAARGLLTSQQHLGFRAPVSTHNLQRVQWRQRFLRTHSCHCLSNRRCLFLELTLKQMDVSLVYTLPRLSKLWLGGGVMAQGKSKITRVTFGAKRSHILAQEVQCDKDEWSLAWPCLWCTCPQRPDSHMGSWCLTYS